MPALKDLQRSHQFALEKLVRLQSCASVAIVRTTDILPMSAVPLSVSSVQIAMMTDAAAKNQAALKMQSIRSRRGYGFRARGLTAAPRNDSRG
jgi:hypothetical protein